MVKAFIFDLDGVITDSAELHFRAWKRIADEINITINYHFNEQLKGVSRMESLNKILEYGGMLHHFTFDEKVELANRKNDYYKKSIQSLTPSDILPGIKFLLQNINDQGYKLGLASASENASSILHSLGLFNLFHAIADITTVKNGKPAPDIFLLAAKELNVDPSFCIGIEDAMSGIEAIKRAGMFAVGVGDETSLKDADYYVQTTLELSTAQMIKAWRKRK